jgi:hypothetical protein
MKIILILLGLTATQIQERSSENLDVSGLYDIDARHFQGPIAVRYQIKDTVIELPESELVSLSFRMGILTSATLNPHRRPLERAEAAKLCLALENTFLHRGFVFSEVEAKEFRKFTEGLKLGRDPTESLPPWRFGWKLERDSVNIVIRPFESPAAPSTDSGVKRYVIALEFGNLELDELVYKRMKAARAKYFPNKRGQILMSEYPK